MNVCSLLSAFLAFVALVLTAVSIATNYWVKMDSPRSLDADPLNPIRRNSKLSGLDLTYDVEHFGLWVGCHQEKNFDKKSCAYIGNRCYSNVCWLRNKVDKTCLDSRFTPVQNCAAYQATRVITILGTLALIVGASLLVVSVCVRSKPLAATGGLLTAVAAVLLMIAMSVFHKEIFRDGPLDRIAAIGFSFVLLAVAWPLAFVASLTGFIGARQVAKDDQEFDSQDH